MERLVFRRSMKTICDEGGWPSKNMTRHRCLWGVHEDITPWWILSAKSLLEEKQCILSLKCVGGKTRLLFVIKKCVNRQKWSCCESSGSLYTWTMHFNIKNFAGDKTQWILSTKSLLKEGHDALGHIYIKKKKNLTMHCSITKNIEDNTWQ